MKKIVTILAVIALSASFAAAQDWESVSRDENGNIVRNAYITNEWFDNWYIGIAGGASTRFTTGPKSDIVKNYVSPVAELNLLKWFTPSVGARFGYMGLNGKEGLNGYNPYQLNHSPLPYTGDYSFKSPGDLSYGFAYLHGDLMWCITNTFMGYKRDRFWNVTPYAHAGYIRLFDNKTDGNKGLFSKNFDQEFGLGAGIYNTFRLGERLVLTLDLRHINHASRYKAMNGVRTNVVSGSLGLAYNIYRTYWNRASSLYASSLAAKKAADEALANLKASQEAQDALAKQLADKDAVIAGLNDEIANLNNRPVEVVPYATLQERAANADLVVYYYINKEDLNFSELHHLDNYVQGTLAADPDHVFYLTGSADKGTGTMERNIYLSNARANNVKKILMKDFGVKEENIVIKATVVTDKHLDGALDRCVLIEKN